MVYKFWAHIDLEQPQIALGDITVAEHGRVTVTDTEAASAAYMERPELEIGIDLELGGSGLQPCGPATSGISTS